MARQRKAPEFQCHIKYKNDLPMPPVSSVLFDSSLTMPQGELNELLRTEGVAYAPTSLERGTRHFHLPAELLKLSVFNLVDLDAFKSTAKTASGVDKDLLLSVEELERKFNISSEIKEQQYPNISANFSSLAAPPTSTTTKFVRPDVTWLRRTEYISSVKNNPNSAAFGAVGSDDAAKALLADPVDFNQILAHVDGTFDRVNDSRHPLKSNLELLQSFPIHLVEPENQLHYSHCLFLGDNSANDRSILQLSASTVNIFNPSPDNDNQFVLQGDFDIQKTDTGKTKGFVIMLPVDAQTDNRAQLAKIGSTFSLRKRRNARIKSSAVPSRKPKKVIKVTRTFE